MTFLRSSFQAPCFLALFLAFLGCRPSPENPERLSTVPIEEAQELELADWGLAGDEGLGELADLALLPGGGTALLDRLGAVVVIYGPNGGEVTRAGGPGEGPGELAPQGLSAVVATDSSLLVPDIQLQRITEFSVDGELLGTEDLGRAAGPAGGVFGVGWRAHPRGGLVLQELAPDGQRVLRFHEGELERLHSFDLPAVEPNRLLPPTPIWAMDPEGRLLAGRSDRAHLEALVAESAEARGVPPVAVALPDQAPVLSGAMGDPEGRFWIQRATPIGEMGMEALRVGLAEGFGGRVWDILESDGRPFGTVQLPSDFRPVEFGPRELGSGGEGSYCLYGIVEDGVGVRSARRVCP